MSLSYIHQYLHESARICDQLSAAAIADMVRELVKLRERRGRLFFIGLGGSAANCSHAVNDFRKLCGIEAYAPMDNVSELTARANDEGWPSIFANEFVREHDALFVLSVGGGSDGVSLPICEALQHFKTDNIFGIVGRDGGLTYRMGKHVLIVPTVEASRVTPHTEAFQSVILHCIVSHPDLQRHATKW